MLEKKRSEIVKPVDVDTICKVHTGNTWKELKLTSNHVGRKFGEFVMTKVPAK
jgi:ribosomal protein S19